MAYLKNFILPVLIIAGVAGIVVLDKKSRLSSIFMPSADTGVSVGLDNSEYEDMPEENFDPLSKSSSTDVKASKVAPPSTKPVAAKSVVTEKKTEEKAETPAKAVETPQESGSFPFNPEWRNAVVNLFCQDRYGGSIEGGSGVIIDPRGVIMTNAHVASMFLFADYPNPSLYNCSVRIGSPAVPRYRAAILHLPDVFIKNEEAIAFDIDDTNYRYGEGDYALLFITGRTDPTASLPENFSYMPFENGRMPSVGSLVYMTAYPGTYLGGILALKQWPMTSSPANVLSYVGIEHASTPDTMVFAGTISGQFGSSGGAIIDRNGKLAGMPTFFDRLFGVGETTDDNLLHAITAEYINRHMKADIGYTVPEFLAQDDMLTVSKKFMSTKGKEYQKSFVSIWNKKGYVVPGTY